MPKLGIVIKYAVLAILVLIVLVILLSFVTQLGNKTLVDETIILQPGSEKVYNIPPGMTYLELQASAPVDERYESIDGHGEGHGVINGSQWSGSLFGGPYTINNNGTTDASVRVLITTGGLNLYTYI
jgi:hypothetical protein